MMSIVMLMCNAEEVLIGITWLTIDNYHKQKQNQKDFKNRASEFYFILFFLHSNGVVQIPERFAKIISDEFINDEDNK